MTAVPGGGILVHVLVIDRAYLTLCHGVFVFDALTMLILSVGVDFVNGRGNDDDDGGGGVGGRNDAHSDFWRT